MQTYNMNPKNPTFYMFKKSKENMELNNLYNKV
jgi:hypothetical protein